MLQLVPLSVVAALRYVMFRDAVYIYMQCLRHAAVPCTGLTFWHRNYFLNFSTHCT